MAEPITALLLGAGTRGTETYGAYALTHPDQIKFIAVAEPDPKRRDQFAIKHAIPKEMCFESWHDALARELSVDVVINSTQDQMHTESSVAALEMGYDMLLEKPIAHTLEGALKIVQTAERHQRYLQISHVLRYTDFFKKIREILNEGRLGQIITISHRENVSAWHMAHSYVRGKWRREDLSSPMILAKCCHDLDLLYWFTGKLPIKISSFGSLLLFRPENAPPGAPERCTDGCPIGDTCPFYAPAIYLQLMPFLLAAGQSSHPLYRIAANFALNNRDFINGIAKIVSPLRQLTEYSGTPRSVISDDPGNKNALMAALRDGPYGRCVYRCDNDVVDHQVVAIEFEGGITATLTMHGHSHEEGRTLRIDGSQASLLAKFGYSRTHIEIHYHRSRQIEQINFPSNMERLGHGGGDAGIMQDLVQAVRMGRPPTTEARESLECYYMAFAAEESRHTNTVIDMQKYREREIVESR